MLTIGSDPEFFFSQDGQVYPAKLAFEAAGFPERIPTMFGKVIVDGAAIELNPMPGPPDEVFMNTHALLEFAVYEIESNVDQNLEIVPEMPIDLKWAEQDEDLAVFGCDPDESIWGRELRPDTIDAAKHPYRYAGFHIHIGLTDWDYDHIKLMDYTIGLATMAIADGTDAKRREIYGKPGVYRPQNWGLEYRTPSNVLLQSPPYTKFAYEVTHLVMQNPKMLESFIALIPEEVLQASLVSTDSEKARRFYNLISTSVGLPPLPKKQSTVWKENWGLR